MKVKDRQWGGLRRGPKEEIHFVIQVLTDSCEIYVCFTVSAPKTIVQQFNVDRERKRSKIKKIIKNPKYCNGLIICENKNTDTSVCICEHM